MECGHPGLPQRSPEARSPHKAGMTLGRRGMTCEAAGMTIRWRVIAAVVFYHKEHRASRLFIPKASLHKEAVIHDYKKKNRCLSRSLLCGASGSDAAL